MKQKLTVRDALSWFPYSGYLRLGLNLIETKGKYTVYPTSWMTQKTYPEFWFLYVDVGNSDHNAEQKIVMKQ